jgi:DNA-directed RNA polymerase II subunit RPB7
MPFFHLELHKELTLYPRFFSPNIKQLLTTQLIEKVEGTCSGRHGFVITVTEVLHIGKGKIHEGAGVVTFPIRFTAVVFRPFKGEVLDAVVTTVNKLGFFADVGPLQVFVSKHLIPSDMSFDDKSNPQSYVSQISDEQPLRVTKDSEVRLRVIGTRVDATEIFAIGTIKEDYLGIISTTGSSSGDIA